MPVRAASPPSRRRLAVLGRQLLAGPQPSVVEASSPGPATEAKTRTAVVVERGTEKVIYSKTGPGLNFPESARWHDGRFYFVDMTAEPSKAGWGSTGRVLSIGPNGEDPKIEVDMKNVDNMSPSGLGWLPDGRMIIVSMGSCKLYTKDASGKIEEYADLSHHKVGKAAFMNDMTVSKAGHCYVDLYTGQPVMSQNKVIMVPPGGGNKGQDSVCVTTQNLACPNGLVLTPDGTQLMIGETNAHKYTCLDVDPQTGLATRQREWSDPGLMTPGGVPGTDGRAFNFNPDGCCLDAEGCIWCASPFMEPPMHIINGEGHQGGGPFCRVGPGGVVLEVIQPSAGKSAIACCIGGADGKTLFMLESKYGPGKENIADPNNGQVRTIRLKVGAAKDPSDPRYCSGYR